MEKFQKRARPVTRTSTFAVGCAGCVSGWLTSGGAALMGEQGEEEVGEGMEMSVGVRSWYPTPKKRESFAARRRRVRKSGSGGLGSTALAGAEGGSGSGLLIVGGEVGADAEPQWNMLAKGGGLARRLVVRMGVVSGTCEW